jgi:hypothetical protein
VVGAGTTLCQTGTKIGAVSARCCCWLASFSGLPTPTPQLAPRDADINGICIYNFQTAHSHPEAGAMSSSDDLKTWFVKTREWRNLLLRNAGMNFPQVVQIEQMVGDLSIIEDGVDQYVGEGRNENEILRLVIDYWHELEAYLQETDRTHRIHLGITIAVAVLFLCRAQADGRLKAQGPTDNIYNFPTTPS